jgi:hypothetical protein
VGSCGLDSSGSGKDQWWSLVNMVMVMNLCHEKQEVP